MPPQKEGEKKDEQQQEAQDSAEGRRPQPRTREVGEEPPQHYDHDSPPESQFRKIKPSGNRYTLLRDEL